MMLDIGDLCVGYDGIEVVHGVSLSVAAGRIVTVIGPNGAGKTTLLHAIMGILHARGRLVLAGEDLSGAGIEDRVEAGMCLVSDNLALGAWRHRHEGRAARAAAMDDIYALFPRLAERRRQAAGTLSGGERQMLAMGRALMGKPRLLMLDEPSLGLAPLIVRDIFRSISSLRETGTAILLVEQNARAALEIADEGHVLEGGRITLSGPSATLANDPRVVQTYLGIGHADP